MSEKTVVKFEYCTSCGYGSKYRSAAELLESNFDVETIGNPEKPRVGAFEVTVGDKVLWSKLGGQGFPKADELVAAMEAAGFKKDA